jgi:hypothetical protein
MFCDAVYNAYHKLIKEHGRNSAISDVYHPKVVINMLTYMRYVCLFNESQGRPYEGNFEKLMELARSEAEKGYTKMMKKE